MRVGISDSAVAQHLRDGLDRLTGDGVVHGVREFASDVAGPLGALDARRQHDDGRLVGGDLRELDGDLRGGALDLGGVAERTVRGVLVAAQTLGGRRVGDDEGVGLRVLVDRVAVEAPARTGRGLVDDRGSSDGRVTGGQDHSPHDGLVLVAVLRVGQVQPAVLLVARLAGGAAGHVQGAGHLTADDHLVGFAAGAGVAGQAVRRHRAVPLCGGFDLLVENDGHGAVGRPGTAADNDVVVGDDVEATRDRRAKHRLPGRGFDDGSVVGEVVTGLNTPLRLPRELDAQVPPVADRVDLVSGVIDQLSLIPVQRDLIAHVGHCSGAGRGVRMRGNLRGKNLRETQKTQYQYEGSKKCTDVTALRGDHRKLLSTGCATASLHTLPVYATAL